MKMLLETKEKRNKTTTSCRRNTLHDKLPATWWPLVRGLKNSPAHQWTSFWVDHNDRKQVLTSGFSLHNNVSSVAIQYGAENCKKSQKTAVKIIVRRLFQIEWFQKFKVSGALFMQQWHHSKYSKHGIWQIYFIEVHREKTARNSASSHRCFRKRHPNSSSRCFDHSHGQR